MKVNATLEDFKRREIFLVQYIERQLKKVERQIDCFDSEGHGKRSAYKDILFRLTRE